MKDIKKLQILDILFSEQLNPKINLNDRDYDLEKIFKFSRLECKLLKFTNNKTQIKLLKDQCKNRNLQTLAAFGEYLDLANLLHKSNIFFIPLKGLHLNLEFYSELSERPIRDVDLLVKEEQLDKLLDILKKNNYFFENKQIDLSSFSYNSKRYDVPPITNKSGIRIELHIRLLDAEIDPDNEFTKESILTSVKYKQGNIEINLMSYEFLILHLIYHSTLKEYFDNGMISLLDLAKISSKCNIDYESLNIISRKFNLYKATSAILSILYNRRIVSNKTIKSNFIYDPNTFLKVESLLIFNTPDPILSALYKYLSNPERFYKYFKEHLFGKNKNYSKPLLPSFKILRKRIASFLFDRSFRSNLVKSHRMKKTITD